jgi:hypothetical protein
MLSLEDPTDHFHPPLSTEALDELLQLQVVHDNVPESFSPDQWLAFGSTTAFRVSAAYCSSWICISYVQWNSGSGKPQAQSIFLVASSGSLKHSPTSSEKKLRLA